MNFLNMSQHIDEIQKYYDKRINNSKDGIGASGQWFPKELTPKMCEEICQKIQISENDKILEIGSGSDVLGNYLRKYCKEYVGVDISFKMLKFSNKNQNLKLIQTTSHTLPFQNNSFDIVVMNSVSMYLKDNIIFKNSLNEIKRVSKSNGKIFIGENITSDTVYWEYNWFNNLNKFLQFLAKPYIRFRIAMAKKFPEKSGKWRNYYREMSKNELVNYFGKNSIIEMSDACCYSIRKKFLEKNKIGNKRVDFFIILKE